MLVSINDETVEVADQTSVAALLEILGFPEKGVTVAVNCAVLWHDIPGSLAPPASRRTACYNFRTTCSGM